MCEAERFTTSRLKDTAVPTLFNHSNPPKMVQQRKAPTVRHQPQPKPSKIFDAADAMNDASMTKPKVGRKAAVFTKKRKDFKRLQNKLDKKVADYKRLTEKLVKAETKLRQTQCNHPSLSAFKPKQRTFLQLQFRSVGMKHIAKYTAAKKDYAIALYHR